jgi:hypothetical protein
VFEVDVTAPTVITPGDECSAAVAVTLGLNGPFDTSASTSSPDAWSCGAGSRPDMWYSFTASCTAPTVVSTCTAARTFDTVLQVFSGSCGNLTELACNDDACGLGSEVNVNFVAGQTYYVRVGGYGTATGVFELDIECGTGTGVIQAGPTGCSSASFTVSGEPHILGTVQAQMSGASGLPVIGFGFNTTPTVNCGCTVGHSWDMTWIGTGVNLTIPCNTGFIGVTFGLQGLDLGGPGGCSNPVFATTDSVTVTIG